MRIFSDMELGEQLGSGMHRIMQFYKPEDFTIDDSFITACFKYDAHALAIISGQKSTAGVGANYGDITEKLRGSYGDITGKLAALPKTKRLIIEQILTDGTITYEAIASAIDVSLSTVEKTARQLKEAGILVRIGSDNGGRWEVKL